MKMVSLAEKTKPINYYHKLTNTKLLPKSHSDKMVFKFIHCILKQFDLNIKLNQNMFLNNQTKFEIF